MEIKTKFGVGDKVFTITPDLKIREFIVESVLIYVAEDMGVCIKYKGDGEAPYMHAHEEDKCFSSREELLAYIAR